MARSTDVAELEPEASEPDTTNAALADSSGSGHRVYSAAMLKGSVLSLALEQRARRQPVRRQETTADRVYTLGFRLLFGRTGFGLSLNHWLAA